MLNAFSMKWKSSCKRHDYLMTFATERWRKLTAKERARHTLENCIACAIQHAQLQESFPGPTFKADLESMYSTASTKKSEEKEITRQALHYVNSFHEVRTCKGFTLYTVCALIVNFPIIGEIWSLHHHLSNSTLP